MSEAGESLVELAEKIAACRICVNKPQGPPLPVEPRPVVRMSSTARICIAGQAPGARVYQSGIPFDDPSGDRLRDWMGLEREKFYDTRQIVIVPMGFCFPGYDANGSDRPPRKECRAVWHDRVFAQMPQLKLILVIGQYAQAWHLGKTRYKTVTETVRNWKDYFDTSKTCAVLPLPHPSWRNSAWLKKNPWFAREVLPLLRDEVARLTTG